MNRLELAAAEREGYSGDATGRRRFLDFVLDGDSAYRWIRDRNYDCISCLWLSPPLRADMREPLIDQLLGDKPGDAEAGRVCVYVCPECGDLGCGAITVQITRSADTVAWSGWRYENNYDPDMTTDVDLPALDFDLNAYARAIRRAAAHLAAQEVRGDAE